MDRRSFDCRWNEDDLGGQDRSRQMILNERRELVDGV